MQTLLIQCNNKSIQGWKDRWLWSTDTVEFCTSSSTNSWPHYPLQPKFALTQLLLKRARTTSGLGGPEDINMKGWNGKKIKDAFNCRLMCFWPLKARWKQFNFVFAILPIKLMGKLKHEGLDKKMQMELQWAAQSPSMCRHHYTSSDELRSPLRGQEPQGAIVGISHYRNLRAKEPEW